MGSFIKNPWTAAGDGGCERSEVLDAESAPEGLDLFRLRSSKGARVELPAEGGHILTVLSGEARLPWEGMQLSLRAKNHCFLPHGAKMELSPGFSGVVLSARDQDQVAGTEIVIRDERLLPACIVEHPLRWILTPQYLSRRAFLHHDKTLLSRAGHPISWFRTTMFDVAGLPKNAEGESVFRMAYNYRTEPNVVYEVRGSARVRMAVHPYATEQQAWHPWHSLDEETTYYLDEAQDGPDVEHDPSGLPLRNKHEVSVVDGYVSLLCLFDPAPTGAEQHRPGAYSDYGPLGDVVGSLAHRKWLQQHALFDPVIDRIALALASGNSLRLSKEQDELLAKGRERQKSFQAGMQHAVSERDPRRAQTVSAWMGEAGLA